MKAKTFSILICASYVAALILLFSIIFKPIHNAVWEKRQIFFTETSGREYKADFIKNHAGEFDAFVLGGSKAGALSADYLSEKTGLNFYNFWNVSGCFNDYENFTKYLIKTNGEKTKKIILHLSSHEVLNFNWHSSLPSKMYKNPFKKIYFCAKNFISLYLDVKNFFTIIRSKNLNSMTIEKSGSRIIQDDNDQVQKFSTDEAEKHRQVFCFWEDYDRAIRDLFYSEANLAACKKNIESLKKIKKLCDENGIELKIVIGPTFLGELYKYKTQDFFQYLEEIAKIQPFWNFGGISEENMNPENFYNGGHYFIRVGNRMIDRIFSEENSAENLNGFGQLLTAQNISEWENLQKEKYFALKEKYDKNLPLEF